MQFRTIHFQRCLWAFLAFALVMPNLARAQSPTGPSGSDLIAACRTGDDGGEDDEGLSDLCTRVLRQNRRFTHEDAEHLLFVLRFTRDKPDLRAHVLTLLQDPTGDNVQPSGDGNFLVTVPVNSSCLPSDFGDCIPQPAQETISTSGFSMKLTGIYRSLRFTIDRNAQLALYTNAYNHLPEGFTIGDETLPPPSSLTHANLTVISNLVKQIGNSWQSIIGSVVPIQTIPSTASCDGEVGSTPQHANYGDRTGNQTSCTPSASGLFASLPDENFPTRKYLTCVKQQGARLTCHTFASISGVELMISQNDGVKVNLSEQDLMEHYRTLWSVGYMHETGDAYEELSDAMSNNYSFAYESAWEYNPSYSRSFDKTTGVYVNSCVGYPSTQPGCSDSAPQAPGICVGINFLGIPLPLCAIADAGVPESPYQATSLTYFWNGADTELSKEYMILNLAFHNAVLFAFNTTPAWDGATATGGYVVYDATDVTTNKGGHFVHIVGLATNDELPTGAPKATGGGYFIVKNSWNNCFGDAGYVYIDWDYVKAVGTEAFSVSGVN